MREIIDRILELEKHEGNGAVVEISDIKPLLLRMKALEDVVDKARRYVESEDFQDIENLANILKKLDESGK